MRSSGLGLLVVVVVAGGLTWLCWPEPARPRPNHSPNPPLLAVAGFQGVSSCSASACHGNGLAGAPCSECTTWALHDPHARAYSVLLDKRSRDIEEKLNPGKGEHRPEQNQLCLNCHVQPGIMQADRSPRFQLADGVGCESCHGAAGNWLHEHTLPGWKKLDQAEKHRLGMLQTANLRVRAEVCTTCHVGKSGVEVNHDLIAAGHPRLRFEFAAYLANYPRHWPEDTDSKRYKDPEAEAWLAGQQASTEAALRLLADRAGSGTAVWPELAEHDCYACHHDLAPHGWRQDRLPELKRQGASPPVSRPGALLLNDWYYAALPVAVNGLDLTRLKRLMTRPAAEKSAVAADATKLAHELAGKVLPAADRNTLLAGLGAEAVRPGRSSWDRDTQLYLGAVALTAADHNPSAAGLAQAVTAVGSLLNEAFLVRPAARLDSPAGYRPTAVGQHWQTLREQLRKTKRP